MQTKVIGLVVTAALIVALIWLLSGKSQAPQGGYQVGLVTPTPVTDGGWSESAYDGVKRIEKELGATGKNAQATGPDNAQELMQVFARENFNVVIGHGGEYFNENMLKLAENFPKTHFLITASDKPAVKNLHGVRFFLEDATYVLGYVAAKITKSKKLACIGPMTHPVIESTFKAFSDGAKAADPSVEVRVVWVGAWDNPARAKEITQVLINDEKVDVIFHNADACAPGVFQAVAEAKEKGVLMFGSNADQNAKGPDTVLASAVLNIPEVLTREVKTLKDGTFDGKSHVYGMPEGVVWISYNKALESKIPADVRKKADEMVEEIKARKFKVEGLTLK